MPKGAGTNTRGNVKLHRCVLCDRLSRFARYPPLLAGWLVYGEHYVCFDCPILLPRFPVGTLRWRGAIPLLKVSEDRRKELRRGG